MKLSFRQKCLTTHTTVNLIQDSSQSTAPHLQFFLSYSVQLWHSIHNKSCAKFSHHFQLYSQFKSPFVSLFCNIWASLLFSTVFCPIFQSVCHFSITSFYDMLYCFWFVATIGHKLCAFAITSIQNKHIVYHSQKISVVFITHFFVSLIVCIVWVTDGDINDQGLISGCALHS